MATSNPPLPATLAILTAALLAPLSVACAAVLAPPISGPVAAVFPPWWSGPHAFAAAGSAGPVVRTGGLPFVLIVSTADRTRLHAAGAWLLLDPRAIGGCAPTDVTS